MKRFLILTSLCLLLGAGVAQAQVTYTVTTVPTFVITTGMAEVLGGVRITASSANTTVASTINYNFSTPCDNDNTDGISITVFSAAGAPNFMGAGNVAFAPTTPVSNSTGSCIVSIVVAGGLNVSQNDYIEIDGARGRVALTSSVAGSIINATLYATPSNSSFFTVPNTGEVAIAEPAYTQSVTPGLVLQCVGTANPEPVLTISEVFNAAFVDYGKSSGDANVLPVNNRLLYGATNNTQIHIQLSSVPAGMGLAPPTTVTSQINGGVFTAGVAGSALLLNTALTTATDVYYDYVCGNQGVCDLTTEVFQIQFTLTDSTATYGTADEGTQLWPQQPVDVTSNTTTPNVAGHADKPRFIDTLIPTPRAAIASNDPCHTDLMFPWTALVPSIGYDTGIVIANTSTDPFGVLGAGGIQAGTCLLTGYSTASPSSPSAPTTITYTTPNIPSGATWANSLSQIAAFNAMPSFEGYIIAVCNFQYGHGSAQISDFINSTSGVAYGYTALIIPDPSIVGNREASFGSHFVHNSGEGLDQ